MTLPCKPGQILDCENQHSSEPLYQSNPCGPLPLPLYQWTFATPSLPVNLCHSLSTSEPLPLPLYQWTFATPSLPVNLCHSLSTSEPLPLPLYQWTFATPSLPVNLCHSLSTSEPLPLPLYQWTFATPYDKNLHIICQSTFPLSIDCLWLAIGLSTWFSVHHMGRLANMIIWLTIYSFGPFNNKM